MIVPHLLAMGLVSADEPKPAPAPKRWCALHATLPQRFRQSYAHADYFGFYGVWLVTSRIKLGEKYSETTATLSHLWPNAFRVATRCHDKSVRSVQFDESTGHWIRSEDCNQVT